MVHRRAGSKDGVPTLRTSASHDGRVLFDGRAEHRSGLVTRLGVPMGGAQFSRARCLTAAQEPVQELQRSSSELRREEGGQRKAEKKQSCCALPLPPLPFWCLHLLLKYRKSKLAKP